MKLFRRTVIALSVLATTAVVPTAAFAQQEAEAAGGVSSDSQMTASPAPKQGSPTVRTLKPGSRGRRVRSLQRRLRIKADGVYGRKTKSAVKRYQRRKRLKVDGIAGPATLRALGLVPKASKRDSVASKNPPADVDLPDTIPAKDRRVLERIAECESGGEPTAVSKDGTYRGKYQFHVDTWAAMGGSGDPAAAPEDEQDKRAWVLYDRQGTSPWGVCGSRAKS
ncbi:transglycosylase family protein [Paraconexibacter sp.]|uniref:transglycosylase family protein n=1 Tax=Paraconexibacter sp. TaxID=2949640 RepID=UPI0035688E84